MDGTFLAFFARKVPSITSLRGEHDGKREAEPKDSEAD
jgi:hypothetical protein